MSTCVRLLQCKTKARARIKAGLSAGQTLRPDQPNISILKKNTVMAENYSCEPGYPGGCEVDL